MRNGDPIAGYPNAYIPVSVPDGVPLDGAVVELYAKADGTMAADVRISAPEEQP